MDTEDTDKLPAGFTAGDRDYYGLPFGEREGEPGEWAFAKNDDEADRAAKENAKESLWAFQSSFLSSYIPALVDDRARKAFDEMRSKVCEDASPLVEAMLGDRLDDMLDDAIRTDGRGHFLSPYDGDEHDADGGGYFYRVN